MYTPLNSRSIASFTEAPHRHRRTKKICFSLACFGFLSFLKKKNRRPAIEGEHDSVQDTFRVYPLPTVIVWLFGIGADKV
jgi:hypothetical protein